MDVLQQGLEMLLGLAREQDDAEVERLAELRGQILQHRQAAAHVKAANRYGHAARAQFASESHGPGKLVRLHADEADDARVARLGQAGGNRSNRHLDVDLVVAVDLDGDVIAEHLPIGAILGDRVQAGEGIGGDPGPPPLNDVPVFIVVRRFDDLDVESFHCDRGHPTIA
ncbi:MAG TPA: hypothetical protein VGR70_20435 [Stellaceae bacterium]|nr:hypothetical protein [Stellaceae bacterium]